MSFTLSPAWEQKLPGWIREGTGRDFLDTMMWVVDGLAEGVHQVRLGTMALDDDPPADAVPLFAKDRRIPQGFNEPITDYYARSASWRQIWTGAGRVRPLMESLAAIWGPTPPKIRLVRNFGWANGNFRARWTTRNPDGTYERHIEDPSNWDWDGQLLPNRAWVIIYAPTQTPVMGEDGNYGGILLPVWGETGVRPDGTFDQKTIGTTAWREYVTRTQYVLDLMKPASVRIDKIIIAFDPASFDPTSPLGTPGMPDGTWANWSKQQGGIQVPTRLDTARYWKGV